MADTIDLTEVQDENEKLKEQVEGLQEQLQKTTQERNEAEKEIKMMESEYYVPDKPLDDMNNTEILKVVVQRITVLCGAMNIFFNDDGSIQAPQPKDEKDAE